MSEDKTCECGDASCGNGKDWEDGVDDTFDRAFEIIASMVAKGEKPIALCVFAIGDKGNLVYETAGAGPSALTEMILSEVCLQVSDHLQERAMNTPGYKEMVSQMEAAAAATPE